jgi:hypothetical protein
VTAEDNIVELIAALERAASQVRDGELLDFENLVKYVTPELAYVVRVERSKAKVGGQEPSPPLV